MHATECHILQLELDRKQPGAVVIYVEEDGFYAILPLRKLGTGTPHVGMAELVWLGETYAIAARTLCEDYGCDVID